MKTNLHPELASPELVIAAGCVQDTTKSPAKDTTRSSARSPARVRNEGFTLLEVLVALAIMGTALVALHQGFSTVLRVRFSTAGLWRVMIHAHNEVMALERSTVAISKQEGVYDSEHPLAGVKWNREVELKQLVPGIQLQHVKLKWSWQNGANTQHYRSEVLLPSR